MIYNKIYKVSFVEYLKMNNLQATVQWNNEIPFELRNRDLSEVISGIDIRDGIKVKLEFDRPLEGLKKSYKGTLSSSKTVQEYLSHIIWQISGHNNPLVESTNINKGNVIATDYRVARFDTEDKGIKTLNIPFETILEDQRLEDYLEALEKKWFVESRNQYVNDCDYWEGFFGTSNNLWSNSFYKMGNPHEKAIQLAHDLEKGDRTTDWSIWFFPGDIQVSDREVSSEEKRVIKEMNNVFRDNLKLERGAPYVAGQLRGLAEDYLVALSR